MANQTTNDGLRLNPEVPERAKRRRFTAEYKMRIVQEADRCSAGEQGALLRREGLYSSHLAAWRRQRDTGALAAFGKKRGRKAKRSPEQEEIERLQREIGRLRRRVEQTEAIIAAQKKVAALEQALEGGTE